LSKVIGGELGFRHAHIGEGQLFPVVWNIVEARFEDGDTDVQQLIFRDAGGFVDDGGKSGGFHTLGAAAAKTTQYQNERRQRQQ
jgi:hypothetical protein